MEVVFLDAVGDGWMAMLLIPEADAGGARRSLEAAGRKREEIISGAAARLSLDCDGRRAVGMAVDLGVGRREVGLGSALLPAWVLLSSMVKLNAQPMCGCITSFAGRRGWWVATGRVVVNNGRGEARRATVSSGVGTGAGAGARPQVFVGRRQLWCVLL